MTTATADDDIADRIAADALDVDMSDFLDSEPIDKPNYASSPIGH